MKRLLILSMLCNQEKYIKQSLMIRQTWGRNVLSNSLENVEMYFFTKSESDKEYIDYDNHIIYVNASDDLFNTGEKTIEAFKMAINFFNFDYCVLTNTATVINIDLVNKFINSNLIDENCYYGGNLIYRITNPLFFRGDFILLSRKNINLVAINGSAIKNHIFYGANDVMIFVSLFENTKDGEQNLLKKYKAVCCIDDFERDFLINDIGRNFYVNLKMLKNDNNDIILNNIIGVTSLIESDKREYDMSELVFSPKTIMTVNGVYKIEKILEWDD